MPAAHTIPAAGPRALEPYLPRVRYLLIDERRYRDSELAPLRNLVAALFRLENSRTRDDIEAILRALVEWLSSAEQSSLLRAFAACSRRFILERFPDAETEKMNELEEVYVEVVNRFDAWEADISGKAKRICSFVSCASVSANCRNL